MAAADDAMLGLGYASASAMHPLTRLGGHRQQPSSAIVAEEVPVALVYNGKPHVVVMGTPDDLEDLAVGFTLTESIVDDATSIERVDVVRASHGIELQIQIPPARAHLLDDRARAMPARTGCGLCGVESIGDALRVPSQVSRSLSIRDAALWTAGASLSANQTLNAETNAVHAAAWATTDGRIMVVREDIGRHNALDKLFGALARSGDRARSGFILVTSRASYEMIQKSATQGVELVAAISRPTGLAIRFAQASGVTLVGLLRGTTANVYTFPTRITE